MEHMPLPAHVPKILLIVRIQEPVAYDVQETRRFRFVKTVVRAIRAQRLERFNTLARKLLRCTFIQRRA